MSILRFSESRTIPKVTILYFYLAIVVGDEIEKLRTKFDYLKKKQGRDAGALLIAAKDIWLLVSEFTIHP